MPEQQLVEIAKAIGASARVLIMDEPTASLSDREVERLFEVIARLRVGGRRHHLHLAPARGNSLRSPIASPCCATADRRHARARRPAAFDADQSDDWARAVGDFSEAIRGARRRRARAAAGLVQGGRRARRVADAAQRRDRGPCGARRLGPDGACADVFGLTPADSGERARSRAASDVRRPPAPSTPASDMFPKIGGGTASCPKWPSPKT